MFIAIKLALRQAKICITILYMQNEFSKENNTTPPSTPTKNKKQSGIWETIKFAFIAFIIVWPIRAFVAQPFIVSGSSMVPTFENNQYLIVDQISYRFEAPERGDVVIFRYPNDTSKFFIKRIIGLPGETVIIEGSDVSVKNPETGEITKIPEPYIKNKSQNKIETKVGPTEYFVMGDNRTASSDSRYWGNLDEHFIVGKALVRLLPVKTFTLNPGHFDYNLEEDKE